MKDLCVRFGTHIYNKLERICVAKSEEELASFCKDDFVLVARDDFYVGKSYVWDSAAFVGLSKLLVTTFSHQTLTQQKLR